MSTAIVPQNTDSALSAAIPEAVQTALYTWLGNITSARTRANYRDSWRMFMEWSQIFDPFAVSQETIIDYRNHLSEVVSERTGKPLANTTINLRLAGLSSFYRHALDNGYAPPGFENPCDRVKRKPVKPYGKSTVLNPQDNEPQQFLKQIRRDTHQGKRDYALMRLMLTTGLRVSAVASATLSDIEQIGSKWVLNYTNKGGEADKAEITAILPEIQTYLSERGLSLEDRDRPLFTATPRGKRVIQDTGHARGIHSEESERPLSITSISRLVRKYAKRAGLAGIHPHSLRHTCAVIASNHGTVAEVSKLLRHKNMQITSIYLDHFTAAESDRLTHAVAAALL